MRRRRSGRQVCGSLRRRTNFREVRQRFLIVCGGERTEPNYLRRFRAPTVVVTIHAAGRSPLELVERARRHRDDERRDGEEYDQVWCVFDRDEFLKQGFNAAIAQANQCHMDVAYSNEAFELWYLLHFQYQDTGMSRHDCCVRLDTLLGHAYAKNSEMMYDELESRLPGAVRNAQRLLAQYNPRDPANDNPSTTVHLLVQQLQRYSV